MLVVRDDTEKARQYAIMRRRATALLGVFALLFVAVTVVMRLYPGLSPFWMGLLRATAEAAMVGQASFEWVVEAVSGMAIRKAREHVPDRDNLSWGKYLQAAVTKRSLGEPA